LPLDKLESCIESADISVAQRDNLLSLAKTTDIEQRASLNRIQFKELVLLALKCSFVRFNNDQ
jgi:hypothetical protein